MLVGVLAQDLGAAGSGDLLANRFPPEVIPQLVEQVWAMSSKQHWPMKALRYRRRDGKPGRDGETAGKPGRD